MSFVHDANADRVITLADGRNLGYCEFGDPSGYPVLNNHAGLACRFDVELAAQQAVELGVRLISPDRPGVGTSDHKPDPDTLDWASDILELMDALDVERFANMGWSMGGQYALAVAHALPDRVSATAVIAGGLPLDDPTTFAQLNAMDRHFTELSLRHPATARTMFATMAHLAAAFPNWMARIGSLDAAPSDRKATLDNVAFVTAILVASARDPQGLVEEYQAWVKPWRFFAAVPAHVVRRIRSCRRRGPRRWRRVSRKASCGSWRDTDT